MDEKEESRIVVDDDWKAQVQREKEQLEQHPDQQLPDMPEASFGMLVTTLTTQALAALGLIAYPEMGKPESNRPLAKHFIDTLAVLEQKTAGNLTTEESQLLNESLHQLRMAYVSTADSGISEVSDDDESTRSSIVLP